MGKIALLFAGQGAQFPGMGLDLYNNNEAARKVFDCGEELKKGTLETCFKGTPEQLSLTQNTQPCLFLTDLACAEALRAKGVRADCVAGFSLGELAALAYANVFSVKDAFRAVLVRAEAMSRCAEAKRGGMAAIMRLTPQKIEEICARFKEVFPVNYNCPGQISCAGAEEEMDEFVAAVKAEGGKAIRIAVSGAFHTPFMENARVELKNFLEGLNISSPEIPVYSDMTAQPYPMQKDGIIDTLSAQLRNSVRWEKILRNMADNGVDTFIEVGAGKTLSGFVSRTIEGAKIHNVSDTASLDSTVSALKEG